MSLYVVTCVKGDDHRWVLDFKTKGCNWNPYACLSNISIYFILPITKKTNLISFLVCISRSEMDGDNLKFLSYMNDLVELFNLGIKLCLFKVICRSCGIDYLTPPKRQDFLMMVLPGNYKFASMLLVSVHLVKHLKNSF